LVFFKSFVNDSSKINMINDIKTNIISHYKNNIIECLLIHSKMEYRLIKLIILLL
jgi:hypothetical protein